MTTTAHRRSAAPASSDALEIRAARADDLPSILALMRASLGEGKVPRHEAFWRWKHEQNPFGRSPVLLAFHEGLLVGLRTFLRWTWMRGSVPVQAVRAVDTATHPAWQGRGIFRTLTLGLVEQMRDEGVSFIYNTPNEKSRPGYLKMGWRDVGNIALWARPTHPGRTALRLALGRSRRHAPAGDAPPETAPPTSLATLLGDGRLSPLLAAPTPADRYATCKTTAFLRWRYFDIPGFTYEARWSWSRDGQGAAVIYRLRDRRGLRECTIADVLSSPGVQGATHLMGLIRHLGQLPVDYLVVAAPTGARTAAAFLGAGLLPVGARGPTLTVRRLDTALRPDPSVPSHWQASVGDFELF